MPNTNAPQPDVDPNGYVDPDRKVKRPWQSWLTGSPVFVISVLIHIIFLALALYFVVQRIQQKRKQNFQEVSVKTAPVLQVERKVQLAQMQKAQSAPDMTQRVLTNELSAINLPTVTMPTDNAAEGTSKMGAASVGGSSNQGLGTAGGGTPMDIDMSLISPSAFGLTDGQGLGLAGHFYDLKQTSDGKETKLDNENYSKLVGDFMRANWPSTYFKKYFVGPKPLYLTQLLIPMQSANNGPRAFDLQNVVQPSRWVALYSGKISVPVSGEYRFAGFADDICEVAINHRTVLDASIRDAANAKWINFPSTEIIKVTFPWGKKTDTTPTMFGKWISLQSDQTYTIQILIGERPGGWFGTWLYVQDKSQTYAKGPEGCPILPLFKVGHVKVPALSTGVPPYDNITNLGWTLAGDEDNTN